MNFEITEKHYINRELSWLDFNARVLDEAGDKSNPVLERLKFIAIFSNNLDEFFMVRIAGLKKLDTGASGGDPSGMPAETQLRKIRQKLIPLLKREHRCLNNEILPELRKHGIVILRRDEFGETEKRVIKNIFDRQIYPALTPVAVDPSHPFPVINSGAIEIAVRMRHHDSNKPVQAFVEVPAVLPRFIPIKSPLFKDSKVYIPLEDIIMENIASLFVKCEILEVLPFRITRDMDFTVDEDEVADLISYIEKKLLRRRSREPMRLEVLKGFSRTLEKWLMRRFNLNANSKYTVDGPLHPANFFQIVADESHPEITEPEWIPVENPLIKDNESIFNAIKREGSIPLFLPFQSFDPVVRLIEEAADDPNVLAIKQTLYRVSGDSPVVHALQHAAENGKQVTVILELKARFDEYINIQWARKLEESGAHVVYGLAGLKIHAKALLIVRKEEGAIRRYLHLSTGNYNDKTARVYIDIGMFLSDEEICSDVSALFNIMTGYSAKPDQWNKISIAPFDLKEKFISLIDREARLSTKHNPGRIIAKMNSLVHTDVIESLYRAAHAGVKIDLIVRGICCMRPGMETDNINIISIVDRYLEHSRIYYFQNGGNPEFYLSSADWMPRNLHHRIEILFPVEETSTCKLLWEILKFQLNDKRKARKLLTSGKYTRTLSGKNTDTRSQWKTYQLFKSLEPKKNPTPEIKVLK